MLLVPLQRQTVSPYKFWCDAGAKHNKRSTSVVGCHGWPCWFSGQVFSFFFSLNVIILVCLCDCNTLQGELLVLSDSSVAPFSIRSISYSFSFKGFSCRYSENKTSFCPSTSFLRTRTHRKCHRHYQPPCTQPCKKKPHIKVYDFMLPNHLHWWDWIGKMLWWLCILLLLFVVCLVTPVWTRNTVYNQTESFTGHSQG